MVPIAPRKVHVGNQTCPAMNEGDRLALMQENLDRVIEWVARLDTKASIVLGIDLALVGFLGRRGSDALNGGFWPAAMFIATVALVGASLWFLGVATFPRTDPPRPSVFFFGSVAKGTAESYQEGIASMTEDEFIKDTAGQIHTLSSLVTSKFKAVQRALICLFVSIAPWLSTVVLVGV